MVTAISHLSSMTVLILLQAAADTVGQSRGMRG